MYGIETVLTEENLNKVGAKGMIEILTPPLKEIQLQVRRLEKELEAKEEELKWATIRNEEQAKVLDGIIKALKM